MLAGALAGRPFRSVLTGDESLRRRPLERVAAPLRAMGARVQTTDGKPPMTIDGGRLRGLTHDLPVASAQVKTAVLLAGLQADGVTTVREPSPSRDHTERMLPAFGVSVEREGLAATVRGGARLRGTDVVVPGDASSAAFLVVAALVLPDSEVRLEGVLLSPTRTAFVEVLRAMGGRVETRLEASEPEPIGSIVASSSSLHGTTVDPRARALAHRRGAGPRRGRRVRAGAPSRSPARASCASRRATASRPWPRASAALGARVRELSRRPRRRGRRPAARRERAARTATTASRCASPWPRSRPRGSTEIEGSDCVAVSFPEFYALLDEATGRA